MNRTWMRERLELFKALCEQYDQEGRQSPGLRSQAQRDLNSQINTEIPTIREIVKRLDPELVKDIIEPQYTSGTSRPRTAIERTLGIVRDQDEWKANLEPDAPALIADEFHPHIWGAASAIWDTGQYRVAVQQAAVSLSAHIAKKSGSSLSERKLVQRVFSTDPPSADQVRLHFPGDRTSDTWRSRQQGLHLIAQGAFAGIRN